MKLTREQRLEVYRLGKVYWDELYKGYTPDSFLCFLYSDIISAMHNNHEPIMSDEVVELLLEFGDMSPYPKAWVWFNEESNEANLAAREVMVYTLAALK